MDRINPSTNGNGKQQPPTKQDVMEARYKRLLFEEQMRLRVLERKQKRLLESSGFEAWEHIHAWSDVVSSFKGSDRDMVYPFSTAQDRRYGANWPFWRTWQEHARLRAASRLIYTLSPLASGAISAITSYVVGEGMQVKITGRHQDTPPEIIREAQFVMDEFVDSSEFAAFQQEYFTRSRRDGEAFVRQWPQDDGMVVLRILEPEAIIEPPGMSLDEASFGIITDPDDPLDVRGYWWEPNGVHSSGEEISSSEVSAVKENVDGTIKRGLPDFSFDTADLLRTTQRLLRNMGEGAAVRSAIAYIRQHALAPAAAVEDFVDSQADYTETRPFTGNQQSVIRLDAATVLDIDKGQEYQQGPTSENEGANVAVVQAMLRGVAVRWNAPEWVVSGDSSNQNMATAMVAESPFVKTCKRFQKKYGKIFQKLAEDFLRNWCRRRGGLRVGKNKYDWRTLSRLITVTITPPTVETRNRSEESQLNRTYIELGVKSRQTVSQEIGVEWQIEERNNEEYEQKHGEQGVAQKYRDDGSSEAGNVDQNPLAAMAGQQQGQQPGQDRQQQTPTGPEQPQGGGEDTGDLERFLDSLTESQRVRASRRPLVESPDSTTDSDDSDDDPEPFIVGDDITLPDEETLTEAGFTGTRQDSLGRHRCYSDGKPVPCSQEEKSARQQGRKDQERQRREAEYQALSQKPPAVHMGGEPEKARESLADMLGDLPAEQAVKLTGAPNGATVHVGTISWKPGAVEFSVFHPAIKDMHRTLFVNNNGELEMHNDIFFLQKKHRGSGMGLDAFSQEVAACAAAGVDKITTLAGKGGIMNGYYTWPRLGYDAKLDDSFLGKLHGFYLNDSKDHSKRFQQALRKAGVPEGEIVPRLKAILARGPRTVLDLMESEDGRALWKGAGYMTDMEFDLDPNSRSMKTLNGYLKSKGKDAIAVSPELAEKPRTASAERKRVAAEKNAKARQEREEASQRDAAQTEEITATYRNRAERHGLNFDDLSRSAASMRWYPSAYGLRGGSDAELLESSLSVAMEGLLKNRQIGYMQDAEYQPLRDAARKEVDPDGSKYGLGFDGLVARATGALSDPGQAISQAYSRAARYVDESQNEIRQRFSEIPDEVKKQAEEQYRISVQSSPIDPVEAFDSAYYWAAYHHRGQRTDTSEGRNFASGDGLERFLDSLTEQDLAEPGTQLLLESLHVKLLEKGQPFTGRVTDKLNRARCYVAGKPVPCHTKQHSAGKEDKEHSAAREHLSRVLSSPQSATPEDLHKLAASLTLLTAPEIEALRKEHGIRAGGPKEHLIKRVTEAAGKVLNLRHGYERQARAAGVPPKYVTDLAREEHARAVAWVKNGRKLVMAARGYYRSMRDTNLSRNMPAFRDGKGSSAIPELELIARGLQGEFPAILNGADETENAAILYDLLAAGGPGMPNREDSYREALGRAKEEKAKGLEDVPFDVTGEREFAGEPEFLREPGEEKMVEPVVPLPDKPKAAAKEPWQMTTSELVGYLDDNPDFAKKFDNKYPGGAFLAHSSFIKDAIKAGKEVPFEVRKEASALEDWEKTLPERIAAYKRVYQHRTLRPEEMEALKVGHRAAVQTAVATGKPVPDNVLADAGFTGTDALNRNWVNGKLVAKPEGAGKGTSLPDVPPAAASTPKPVRFQTGKALTPEQKKVVLDSVKDVYKDAGLKKTEIKGYNHDDDPIYGYPYSPDLFVRSDITGTKVRHFITLPDGKKAHPSELFPNLKQADIDRAIGEQDVAKRGKELRNDSRESRHAETKGDANQSYQRTNRAMNHSFLAKGPDGRIVRVDGTDAEDLQYFDERGYQRISDPVPSGTHAERKPTTAVDLSGYANLATKEAK